MPTHRYARVRRRLLPAAVCASFAVIGSVLTVPAPQAQAAPDRLHWGACDRSFMASTSTECATLRVPRSYDNLSGDNLAGPTIELTVSRIAARDPGRKRGVLVGNPGGPGLSAIGMFSQLAMPQAVRDEWDLVAVQPRGLPGATPVRCAAITDPSRLISEMGLLNRERCDEKTTGYYRTLTTETGARDVEQVRRALGVDKLSLFGLSYGTWLFATYATLFPKHTGRLILDSAMDPAQAWSDILIAQTTGYKRRVHEMMAWIADNDRTYHQGTTPLAVYRAWSARIEKQAGVPPSLSAPPARVGDVPPGLQALGELYVRGANLTADTRARFENYLATVTNPGKAQVTSELLVMTRLAAPDRNMWSIVGQLLASEREITVFTPEVLKDMTASTDMQQLMVCNENRSAVDPTLWPASYVQNFIVGDIFEAPGLLYKSGTACAGTTPVGRPVPVRNRGLTVRPLQIQSTGDPQTPYRDSLAMRRAMGAHLITVGGGDHGQFGRLNTAVDNAVVTYLRTGRTTVTSATPAPIRAPLFPMKR
jgi:pimeloyl-ACP methyl ester carboxylesterase